MKNYQKMFILLAAFALVACAQATAVDSIAANLVQQRIEAGTAPLILDVRTAAEYAEGHVPGAVNISHDELENRLSELGIELDDELIVYCRSGRRAGIAQGILVEAGYTNLRDLEGHWLGWSADGRPSE